VNPLVAGFFEAPSSINEQPLISPKNTKKVKQIRATTMRSPSLD
jgi:hypothetical protein